MDTPKAPKLEPIKLVKKNKTERELARAMRGFPKVDNPDPKYSKKYKLQEKNGMTLDDSRFPESARICLLSKMTPSEKDELKAKDPDFFEELEEEEGRLYKIFPPSGTFEHDIEHDADQKQYARDAMKRPRVPLAEMPDRLPTMGEMPYPPVETPLIGMWEEPMNIYLLMANGYNFRGEQIDKLRARIEELERKLIV
jgi:hypothetical protein